MATIHDGKVIGPCSACKWWISERHDEFPEDWGKCALTERNYYDIDANDYQYPNSLAKATSGDSVVDACLRTSPNFGCVQWEVRS